MCVGIRLNSQFIVRVSQSSITPLQEGNKLFSGGVDNLAIMYDAAAQKPMPVGKHDAPIKCVKWIDSPQAQVLATGSWDKTLKVSRSP